MANICQFGKIIGITFLHIGNVCLGDIVFGSKMKMLFVFDFRLNINVTSILTFYLDKLYKLI